MYERERPQISEKIGIIKETEEDFQNFSSTSKKFENTLNSQNKIKLLWNGSTEQESLQMKNNCLKIKQEIKKNTESYGNMERYIGHRGLL